MNMNMKMIYGIPRRSRMDLYTPAEKAISAAVEAVEMAGAHVLLTDAVNLLTQAKSKVADFVELQPLWQCRICGHVMTEEQSKGYRMCPTGFHGTAHMPVTDGSDWPTGEDIVAIEPMRNRKGSLCGLCDGTDAHEHPQSKCLKCGAKGLSENMAEHRCTSAAHRK